jgi:phosphoenolpyruvate carboxylase
VHLTRRRSRSAIFPAVVCAGDEIMAMVSAWSWERADQVARAFTVYFHLVNLAEEQQRVRTLRLRDSGDRPPRESLADAVDRLTKEGGAGYVAELLAGLRVHPVFTAHPTEARRRAVVAALRRVSGLLTSVDDQRAGSAQQAEDRRELREQVDLLWRTAQLVRSVMTAFDETLFRLVPAVYRALDQVLLGPESGATVSPVPPFLRFGSWVGADRDGNPNVTAAVTREAAVIQAEHALRGLEAACGRIGRALTVDEGPVYEGSGPPSAARSSTALGRALSAAAAEQPELLAEITARSPGEPYRAYLLYATRAARRDPDQEP